MADSLRFGRPGTWRRLLALATLVLSGLPSGRTNAQPNEPVSLSARAGFDGYFKGGSWIPVRVTLANSGPDFQGALQVTSPRFDGTEVAYTRPAALPTQSRKEFFVYAAPEGFLSQIKVTLVSGRKIVASATVPVTQVTDSDVLYGVMAGAPSAFAALQLLDPLNGRGLVAQLAPEDLPPVGQAWRALDVLVISDTDTGGLDQAQRTALAGWVAAGGRLIVAGGPGWQKTVAGLGSVLPVSVTDTRSLSDFTGLTAYAGASEAPAGPAIVALGQPLPGATPIAASGGWPLVVARTTGWGEVDYLAFDPALEPFKSWSGIEGLYRNLLSRSQPRPSWAQGLRNWSSAADAVNAIPGIGLPSALALCGFLGVYVLIVGPFNYLFLRRLKKLEWAWVTVPAAVVIFSGMAYVAGFGLRGTRATLHRLSIVQVWTNSERAQVEALIGVLSPRRTTYDLEIGASGNAGEASDLLVRPLPSNGYGNLNTAAGAALSQEQATRIQALRIEVGGLQAFAAQGQIPAPKFESALRFSVLRDSAVLDGSITNSSDLTLHAAVLLGPGSVQHLGDFAPGATLPVNLRLGAGRAVPAGQSNSASVLPTFSGRPLYPAGIAPGYYGGYDMTMEDVLGSTDYYDDRELYRKFSLLSAMLDPYSDAGRGAGVYLVGWTDTSPVPATILNRAFVTSDLTAWFIHLEPEVVVSGGQVTIHPGLMTWSVPYPDQQGATSPYDAYIYAGAYVLQFAPSRPIEFSGVSSLTLHLISSAGSGTPPLEVAVWDYEYGQFAVLNGIQWGDNVVAQASRYVGPEGEIRVQVTNPGNQNAVNLDRLDFTLVVER